MLITLKDGKNTNITSCSDILDIIREYAGEELMKEAKAYTFTDEDFDTLEKIKEITDQDEVYRLVNTII